MSLDPQTFRSQLLSLYQSAIDAAVLARLPAGAPRPGLENDVIRAAAQVATFHDNDIAIPQVAPPHIAADAWTTARLAFQLLQARLAGNDAEAEQIEANLQGGQFDPNWVATITEYLEYFGPDGTLRERQYIPPSAGMAPLTFRPGSVIGLLADWGIGTAAAVTVVNQMAQFNPDVIIHLGDIYYSGTPDECQRNFADILNRTFDRSRVPIYNMVGNHDMYCGGVGFYQLLGKLNPPPLTPQPASFFCLRSTDNQWQFIAMDTGRFDYDPFGVQDVLVRIEEAEQQWLAARIAEFAGRTILLSHHQLFSAFAQIGAAAPDGTLTPYNPQLRDIFASFTDAAARGGGSIAAWFWGHEHTLSIYAPYLGLQKGRCIGHGAIPVLIGDGDDPLTKLVDPPKLLSHPLGADGSVHAHGFAILTFAHDGSCQVGYYNDTDPGRPFYSETLGGGAVQQPTGDNATPPQAVGDILLAGLSGGSAAVA